jgi:vacuolar-type H+-ATPase subunit I/STV1
MAEITQEQLDKAVEEATAGLVAKNAELLRAVRKLKQKDGIDPQQMAEAETTIQKLSEEKTALVKELKIAQTSLQKAQGDLEKEMAFAKKTMVEAALSSELGRVNVAPQFQKAAMALLLTQSAVEEENSQRVVKLAGKGLAEALKEWAASEEGKHFVAAPQNSGTNAPGAGGAGGEKKTIKRSEWEALPPENKLTALKDATLVD